MSMSRRRRTFGPLLYGVLSLASLVLVGLYLWGWWPTWRQHWELRSLAEEIRSPSSLASRHAADQLVRAGSAGVPILVEASGDRDGGVRLLAVSALGRTAPVPGPVIPVLVAGLRDPDVRVRRQAAGALGRFGPSALAAEGLMQSLEDGDPDVRLRAARSLSQVEGRSSERVVGVLLALLTDPVLDHIPDRAVLVPVISRMGTAAESQAVSALLAMMDANDRLIRRTAIECLEQFGARARDAIPALERALRDGDQVERCRAALALSWIEESETGRARAMLKELVDSPSLPPGMQKRVKWAITTDFVNGSEITVPFQTLRDVVAEFRRVEARKTLEATMPDEEEEAVPNPEPRSGPGSGPTP